MTERLQVYKCNVCGNAVEVVHASGGTLVCCGQNMALYQENTVDAAKEKHVPVSEASGNTLTVSVGSAPHPMEEKHWIEWVEVISGDKVTRQHLNPGEDPKAVFEGAGDNATVRALCNLHGLWKE